MRSFAQATAPDMATDPRGPIESLVSQLVIPRLVHGRRRVSTGNVANGPGRRGRVQGTDVETFVGLLLSCADGDAAHKVESLIAAGETVDDIALFLLAPAARSLGARWEDDTLDFAAVTTGMTRLHVLLHMMGRRYPSGARSNGRRILIANNPGETHAFGPLMVAEHFRRAGWDSRFDPAATTASLARDAGAGILDAMGLSCAAERYLGDLHNCIRAIRAAARGRPLCLMVGGNVFTGRPELAARMGADVTAQDAPGALAAIERLLPVAAAAH
jgi:methanogenic corrinoid protein MtbC1